MAQRWCISLLLADLAIGFASPAAAMKVWADEEHRYQYGEVRLGKYRVFSLPWDQSIEVDMAQLVISQYCNTAETIYCRPGSTTSSECPVFACRLHQAFHTLMRLGTSLRCVRPGFIMYRTKIVNGKEGIKSKSDKQGASTKLMPASQLCCCEHICSQRLTHYSASPTHLLQMVWSSTTHLGCAVAQCHWQGQEAEYLVCRYTPAGNVLGQFAGVDDC